MRQVLGISTVFRGIDRRGEKTRKIAAGLRENSGLSLKNSCMGSAEGRGLWENRIPETITELKEIRGTFPFHNQHLPRKQF